MAINPWTERKYKLNTYQIEYAARHNAIDGLYLWLHLKALDVERNAAATGKLFGINDSCKRIALKTKRSLKTIKRHLNKAEQAGYISLDLDQDLIEIKSRKKITLSQRNMEFNCAADGVKAPDDHVSRVGDIMAVSVALPEIWSKTRGVSHAKLFAIARQHITERGMGRSTLAKLLGKHRRSTARSDVVHNARRGYQYATIQIQSLAKNKNEDLESLGQKIVEGYQSRSLYVEGNGKKLWYGTHDGNPVLFTQLGVKYDTKFRCRLKPDVDVIRAFESFDSPDVRDECWPLHPVFSERELNSDASRGVGIIGESTRQSIYRTLKTVSSGMKLNINTHPAIIVVDTVTWPFRSFGTNESPNQRQEQKLLKNVNKQKKEKHNKSLNSY